MNQSSATWLAAHEAAERAIPILMAKARTSDAVYLARRSKEFLRRSQQ